MQFIVVWRGEYLRVVVEQESLHDQDMNLLLVTGDIGGGVGHGDTVGAGKLDGVLHPTLDGVGHGLHIQGCDHWGVPGKERRKGWNGGK